MLFYLHFVSTFTRCYALSGLCRSRNMSVCLSTHRYSVEVARVSSNLFHHRVASSHTILAFPYNTVSQYSDRDHLTGVSNGNGVVALLSQRPRDASCLSAVSSNSSTMSSAIFCY